MQAAHEFPLAPKAEDGPVTVTTELIIRPKDREEFLALKKELRLVFLRTGAFFLPCRRNTRASKHLPGGNASQFLGRASETAHPHNKSRNRARRAGVEDARGRPRTRGQSQPSGGPDHDSLGLWRVSEAVRGPFGQASSAKPRRSIVRFSRARLQELKRRSN